MDRWRGIEVSELAVMDGAPVGAGMDEAQGVTLRGTGDSAGTGGSNTGASGVDGSESVAGRRRCGKSSSLAALLGTVAV